MKKLILALLVIGCLALVFSSLLVNAAPPVPSSFYGTVKVNGANPPTYIAVEALIGGVTYVTQPVSTYGSDVVYSLDVPGDIPETPGKEGGVAGEVIQFRVGGLLCNETGTWQPGQRVALNLTASGALATPTATNTLPPTDTPSPTATRTNTPQATATPQVKDLRAGDTVIKDTFLSSWETGTAYGSDPRIRVRSVAYRGLIRFDLATQIPANALITNASLRLYLDNYSHLPDQAPVVSVYKLKQNWGEYSATWNVRDTGISWGTPGAEGAGDRASTVSGSATITQISNWYEWELTGLVQDWVSNPSGNQGMILLSDNSRELRFYSRDDPDARFRPYLHVEYIEGVGPGPTVTPPSPTATGLPGVTPTPGRLEIRGASQDVYINEWAKDTNHENQDLRLRGTSRKRGLIDFGLAGRIPVGAKIHAATLRLTASEYNDGKSNILNVGVYQVNNPWIANQATWNLRSAGNTWGGAGCEAVPGDRAGSPASVTQVQKVSGTTPSTIVTYDWNVTTIVQDWVNHPERQAGLLLMATDQNEREVVFRDSNYSLEARRPLLLIDWSYTPPTNTPTATPTVTPTATATPTVTPTARPVYDKFLYVPLVTR